MRIGSLSTNILEGISRCLYYYFVRVKFLFIQLHSGIYALQLDGYIARHVKGQSSLLGSALDPIADKFLVSTLFITLTYVDLIPC